MKGFGTDEKAIIAILGNRTTEERQKLKTIYKTMHGKDLVKELKSELGGKVRYLVKLLMMESHERDAFCLFKSMKGIGTDDAVLVEIMCSRSNSDIAKISEVYKTFHNKTLEKAIESDTSSRFRKLLISLSTGSRDESLKLDPSKAAQDAVTLKRAGEDKWGTDEAQFNSIFALRSFAQLKITFEEYERHSKYKSMEDAIKGEFSGDIQQGLRAIVEMAKNPPGYFAHRLHKSMDGMGTDEQTLSRVVAARCDVDMVEIKKAFHQMYGKPLGKMIKGDTSGDYEKLLLALIGGVETF